MVKQNMLWYLKKLAMIGFIAMKMFGLYYADVLSDILQTVSLYNNCHKMICAISVGIITSSYVITSLCIKFTKNLKWSSALFFPWVFE